MHHEKPDFDMHGVRGTPAEATGCLVENHAELVGSDTLVIVDSQGNVVWDETGCSSIHAPSP